MCNRYEICTRLGIAYKTVQREFANENEVQQWIILNQFGRRNLNNFIRAELALKLKPLIAEKARENLVATGKAVAEITNQGLPNSAKLDSQPTIIAPAVIVPKKPIESVDTRQEIAKVANVGHDTIARTEVILKKATPQVIEQVRAGEVSINQAYQEIKKEEKIAKRCVTLIFSVHN